MTVKGFAAREVAEVYGRSEELLRRVGETEHAFPVDLGALWYVKQHSGGKSTRHVSWRTSSCQLPSGIPTNPFSCRRTMRHGLAVLLARNSIQYASIPSKALRSTICVSTDPMHCFMADTTPGMCCRIIGGLTLLLLGFPEKARKLTSDGVKVAEDIGHAFSQALALSFSGTVYLYLREPRAVRDKMEALSTLCSKHGFGHFGPMATMLSGWAEVEEKGSTAGIETMREGLAAFRTTGAKRLSFQLTVLADALGRTGQFEEALQVLSEALDVVDSTGERRWEPEVHRLRGDMLCSGAMEQPAEAEECFRRAIDLSRQQDASWFELRATTSFCRLLSEQGRRSEACDLLYPAYTRFTEGFETPDLKEAKGLLDQVA